MKTHELKCVDPHFTDVEEGRKDYEVRVDDRGFEVGDVLVLRQYSALDMAYSGWEAKRRVKHILRNFHGLQPGWVVLGLEAP